MLFAVKVTVSSASWFLLVGGTLIILFFVFNWSRNEVSLKTLGYGVLAGVAFVLLGIFGLLAGIQLGGPP